jgi:hypothetical protein
MTTLFKQLLADATKAYDLANARTAQQIATLDEKAAAIKAELGANASSFAFRNASSNGRDADPTFSLGGKW